MIKKTQDYSGDTLVSVKESELFQLHPAQEDVYYDQLLIGNTPKYTISGYADVGKIKIDLFQKAWALLYKHIDALRLCIVERDGAPRQYDQQDLKANQIQVYDFSSHDNSHLAAVDWMRAQCNTFISYDQPRLCAGNLLKLSDTSYYFNIHFHHIFIDGIGSYRLYEYLTQAYHDLVNGDSTDWLQDIPQFRPVVDQSLAYLSSDKYTKNEGFFEDLLQSHESINLPDLSQREQSQHAQSPGEAHTKVGNGTEGMVLSVDTTRQLKAFCETQKLSMLAVFSGACSIVLSKTFNTSSFLLNTVVHGRQGKPGMKVVGMHVNTLPYSANVDPSVTVVEQAGAMMKSIRKSYRHSNYPFSHLSRLANRLGRSVPEVTVAYDLFATDGDNQHFVNGLVIDNDYQDHPMLMRIRDYGSNDDLHMSISYNNNHFTESEVKAMLQRLEITLQAMLASPDAKVADIDMLLPGEKQRLLTQFNPVELPYPADKSLPALFAEQVALDPDRVALYFAHDQQDGKQERQQAEQQNSQPESQQRSQMTYGELDAASNQLAHYIIASYWNRHSDSENHDSLSKGTLSKGTLPRDILPKDTLIGVYQQRDPLMIVSLLAILKAGGAYVPLSMSHPNDRLAFVLEDTAAPLVLTLSAQQDALNHILTLLPEQHARPGIMAVDALPDLATMPSQPPQAATSADDLAYVIYTSGTTGKPKGVLTPQRGITSLVLNNPYGDFSGNDVFLQLSDPSFDAATLEIWGALTHGSPLVVPETNAHGSAERMRQLLQDYRVSVLWLTRALFDSLYLQDRSLFAGLRALLVGGEALTPALIRQLSAQTDRPGRIINGYGPTESTTFATTFDCEHFGDSVPIGFPINTRKVYVLSDTQDAEGKPSMQLAPQGVPGELYIGGAGLARGYLNRPDLTAERFVANPFATEEDLAKGYDRLYKTGDLVRFLDNGAIEFIGRNDDQVKIRGYRIELGEIEAAMMALPGIKQVAVIDRVREAGSNNADSEVSQYLAAYVVADSFDSSESVDSSDSDDKQPINTSRINALLSETLPDYMIPATFTFLDSLPVTVNGKLDRRALPEPVWRSDDDYVAPRDELETKLCELWQQVLNQSRIGIEDNFFRVGGDSIICIQLVSRLRQHGYQLSVKTVFEAPTIAQLAKVLAAQSQGIAIEAEQGELIGAFGLLPVQQWFFEQEFAAPEHWNQAFLIQLPPGFNTEQVAQALQSLVQRHDMLRARFEKITNTDVTSETGQAQWQQVYTPVTAMAQGESAITPVQLSTVSHFNVTELTEAELQQHYTQWQNQFHIETGPLWQAVHLTGFDDGSSKLFFALHHLIIDAVSWRILADDLQQVLTGQSLAPKTSSYRQWVQAVHDYGVAAQAGSELTYWQNVTADMQPVAHAFPRSETVQTRWVHFTQATTNKLLQQANQGYHTEINDLLLTALAQTLSDTFGENVHHIRLEGHGREDIAANLDVSQTVGWFTSMYPVRLTHQPDSIETTIIHTKEMLRAIPAKGVGYNALRQLGALNGELPEVSFNYLGQFSAEDAPWQVSGGELGEQVAAANLGGLVLDINGGVQQGQLQFRVESFLTEQQTITFVSRFEEAVLAVVRQATSKALLGGLRTPSDFALPELSVDDAIRLQNQFDVEAIYPANSLQQGFIFHHVSQPNDDAYRVQILLDYQLPLDREKYQQAWRLASLQFPVLRTAFDWESAALQVVTEGASLSEKHFHYLDIRNQDPSHHEAIIKEKQQDERRIGFDLSKSGLMRFNLIQQRDDLFTVILNVHHAIIDGWSNPILFSAVHEFYNQLVDADSAQNADSSHKATQLEDKIQVDTAYQQTQVYYQQQQHATNAYWDARRGKYPGANDVSAMLSHAVDLNQVKTIDEPLEQQLVLDGKLYQKLRQLCQTEGLTLNVVAQFAWHKLIQTYSADTETIVGTTVSGRDVPIDGIESSVGLFINTLPLLVDWSDPQRSVLSSLRTIAQDIADLNSHSAVSLASLQDGERLFHSLFVYENYPMPVDPEQAQGIERHIALRGSVEKLDYPLSVMVFEEHNRLVMNLSHSADWLTQHDAGKLLQQLQQVFEQIAENPQQTCFGFDLLSAGDKARLIHDLNQSDADYSMDHTFVQLFEAQVQRTPKSTALIFADQVLSYEMFNARANQLAHAIRDNYLHSKGQEMPADSPIALFCERGVEMMLGILAIMKAGGAYVPISPDFPAERTSFILQDTNAALLLTQSHLHHKAQAVITEYALSTSVLNIDNSRQISSFSNKNLQVSTNPHDLAYILYTSGTTGKPKGVMLEQGVFSHFVQAAKAWLPLPRYNTLSLTRYTFDIFGLEYALPLISGDTVVLTTTDRLNSDLSEHLENIDFIQQTPSMWRAIFNMIDPALNLKHISAVVGGEAGTKEIFDKLAVRLKAVCQVYGPTEACIWSTSNVYENGLEKCIGRPMPNEQVYVLDQHRALLPFGAPGELYIGGAGLARGYWNREDLTNAAFFANPFSNDAAFGKNRIYKTGDQVRLLPDGSIEYLNRNDGQVKIRGFRIETGEVETALSKLDNVLEAVVIDREKDGSKYLAAYLVMDGELPAPETLNALLSEHLPEYMVPSTFTQIDAVPLSASGKLDRRALPEPHMHKIEHFVAPETPLQEQLCTLWQGILKLDRVGTEDNFFRIGGDSILSIQLVSKLRQLGYQLQVKAIFEAPTITQLADLLEKDDQESLVDAEQGQLNGDFDLLPSQQWFFDQAFVDPNHWNQAFMFTLPQSVTEGEVRKALITLAEQHDMLRARFEWRSMGTAGQQDGWKQVYTQHSTLDEMRCIQLSDLAEGELQAQLNQLHKGFDLVNGPLWRVALISGYADGLQRVCFALHHLITDAVSWQLLQDDLRLLLDGKALPHKTSSYRQWVEAVEALGLQLSNDKQEVAYWQQINDAIAEDSFTTASASTTSKTDLTSVETIEELHFSPGFTEQLQQEANQGYHTKTEELLLSALARALSGTFDHDTHYIVLEGHGREDLSELLPEHPQLDVSRTVGWFTNMYPVQLQYSSEHPLEGTENSLESVIITTKEMLRTIPNKGLGYSALKQVNKLQGKLPGIMFNFLGTLDGLGDGESLLTAFGEMVPQHNRQYAQLNINCAIINGQLICNVISRLPQHLTLSFLTFFESSVSAIVDQALARKAQGGMQTASDFAIPDFEMEDALRLQNRYNAEAIYPATSLQQGFIYHHVSQPDDDAYRVQLLLDYSHQLDIANFKEAWRLASLQFPILRTAFDWEGEVVQVVSADASVTDDTFVFEDISALPASKRDEKILQIQQADRAVPFDLRRPGLFRITIIKQSDTLYTILKSEHHSIGDGWSAPVLWFAVNNFYQQLMAGVTPRITPDTAYLAAQDYYRDQQGEIEAYWKPRRGRFPLANDLSALLSEKVDLSAIKSVADPAEQQLTITGDSYHALKTLCQQEGVTLNVVAQFAWHKLVQSYSADSETVVGTTVSGRDLPVEGIEASVGLYINTLPLLVDWSDSSKTVREQLQTIQQDVAALNSFSAVSLASLQTEGERLFHSLFVFENYPKPQEDEAYMETVANNAANPNDSMAQDLALRTVVEKVDYPLSLMVFEEDDSLVMKLSHGLDFLSAQDAQHILQTSKSVTSCCSTLTTPIYRSRTPKRCTAFIRNRLPKPRITLR